MENKWTYHVSSKHKLLSFNFKEAWYYKDLMLLFVKRDLITVYKQTLLGYAWYFIQPLFTSVVFTLLFNNLANIDVGNGINPFLFNLAGISFWNYFNDCFLTTSKTFVSNQGIFKSVYFPRVILPLSTVVSKLAKFGIQLLTLFGFYAYFKFFTNSAQLMSVTPFFTFLPLLIILTGLLGLGLGMIAASMTTKYRDVGLLLTFLMQLLMYGSAVMYPMSLVKEKVAEGVFPKYSDAILSHNPIAIIIESFRYMTFGIGEFSMYTILYLIIITLFILCFGLLLFNRTEKHFLDTV